MDRSHLHSIAFGTLRILLVIQLMIAISFAAQGSANFFSDSEARWLFVSGFLLGLFAIALFYRRRWGYYGLGAAQIGIMIKMFVPYDGPLMMIFIFSLLLLVVLTHAANLWAANEAK
jgi:hypothetical protein